MSTTNVGESVLPVPAAERNRDVLGQFWIWAGANIAPINWVLGALGVGMGLGVRDTLVVLVLGNLLGMGVFGFFVLLGQRSGVTAMVLGRGPFGRRGNYLPATIQLVVVIGWCAVNTWIILGLVMALFGKLGLVDPSLPNSGAKIATAAVIMTIQVAISRAGYRAISLFEKITVPLTLVVLVGMSVVAWGTMHLDWTYAGTGLAGPERWVAMSQVMTAIGVGWGLTWLTYAADYSRVISRDVPRRRLYLASALGQIIPVVWLGALGASLATRSAEVDPGQMIVESFGALALPVLLLVVHGPIATNILNVYSFSVTAKALDTRISRRTLSVIVGVFSMAAVVVFIMNGNLAETLDAWLSGVVGWTATWGAVMAVHYFVLDRRTTDFTALCDPVGSNRLRDVNWRGLVAFGLGVLATWTFMYGMVPALQGPAARALGGFDLSWLAGMVVAGGTYWLLARGQADPTFGATLVHAVAEENAEEPAPAALVSED